MEYLKAAWALTSNQEEYWISSQNPLSSTTNEELLDIAVTYLCMAKMDLQSIFSLDNSVFIKDPQYVAGTVKLIEVLLSSYFEHDATDKHNFSPALSTSIVEFLSNNSPETLVDLVIRIPFLRENHSTRLIEAIFYDTVIKLHNTNLDRKWRCSFCI